MSEVLQTERLILRKLTLNDTDFIIELVNSPGWLQYIGYRNIHTTEDALKYLQDGPLKSYGVNIPADYLSLLKSIEGLAVGGKSDGKTYQAEGILMLTPAAK